MNKDDRAFIITICVMVLTIIALIGSAIYGDYVEETFEKSTEKLYKTTIDTRLNNHTTIINKLSSSLQD